MVREIFLPHAATALLRSGVAAHGRRKHTAQSTIGNCRQPLLAAPCRSIEKNEEGHMSKFESLSGSESQLQQLQQGGDASS